MGAIADRLRRQMTVRDEDKAAALDVVGHAFARAIADAAPGKIGQTVRWHLDSPTSGRITMAAVARYVLHGHKAYDIVPRDKQALAWRGGRHPVKRVHMPAKAPNDFVARAWQSAAVIEAHGAAARALLRGLYVVARKV